MRTGIPQFVLAFVMISACSLTPHIFAEPFQESPTQALLSAADNSIVETATAAINAGADVNATDSHGFCVLEVADRAGDQVGQGMGFTSGYEEVARRMDIIKLLLNKGADITKAKHRWQLLVDAIGYQHYDVASMLLDRNIEPADYDYNTLFSLSTYLPAQPDALQKKVAQRLNAKRRHLFENLLAQPERLNDRSRALFGAINSNDAHYFVHRLLQKGVKVDQRDAVGATPLIAAILQGKTDIVTLLLDNGANPNLPFLDPHSDYPVEISRRYDGKTPLRLVLEKKQSTMVALLKKAGAQR